MTYIVTYWERDPYADYESARAQQLDLLAALTEVIRNEVPLHLQLGETALLGEVEPLRPDLHALVLVYNAAGQVSLGPWYLPPNAMLVSGEALIRNLLLARLDAERWGLQLNTVADLADMAGLPAQLPQILRGFEIKTVIVSRGAPADRQPFRWQGIDDSISLALNFDPQSHEQTLGNITLLQQSLDDHASTPAGDPVSLASLVEMIRQETPDLQRPVIKGELFQHLLMPGVFSARIPVKQATARLENWLTYAVDPWLALALTQGHPRFSENLRARWRHSWRVLLRSQASWLLDGTGSDMAQAEQELQQRQLAVMSQDLSRQALKTLPGTLASAPVANDATYIMVWNPHNWQAQGPVQVAIQLAAGQYPGRLLDADGGEVLFAWADGVLHFVADAPPVGYTAYKLELARDNGAQADTQRRPGTSIQNLIGDEKLLIENEQLIWRHTPPRVVKQTGQLVEASTEVDRAINLLRFYDGGDAGDAFNYSPPEPNIIALASLISNPTVETTRLYQRLVMQHRLRLNPELNEERGRVRGVKVLELTTTATLYHDMPGVYFHTTFENTIKDHRLRVHLNTGLMAQQVIAGSAFGLVKRPIETDGSIIATQPIQRVCAVDDGQAAMALLTRGLPEYEALHEEDQVTLALTLLRAVGWRSRDDLHSRTASLGKPLTTPDAQCLQPITAEYALRPLPTGDPVALLQAGQLYNAPLQAYHYVERPPRPNHSYLSIESSDLIMTALKPPAHGAGWIVRLFNPTDETVSTRLQTPSGLKAAQVVSMAEVMRSNLTIEGGNHFNIIVEPQEILTLRLEF